MLQSLIMHCFKCRKSWAMAVIIVLCLNLTRCFCLLSQAKGHLYSLYSGCWLVELSKLFKNMVCRVVYSKIITSELAGVGGGESHEITGYLQILYWETNLKQNIILHNCSLKKKNHRSQTSVSVSFQICTLHLLSPCFAVWRCCSGSLWLLFL